MGASHHADNTFEWITKVFTQASAFWSRYKFWILEKQIKNMYLKLILKIFWTSIWILYELLNYSIWIVSQNGL